MLHQPGKDAHGNPLPEGVVPPPGALGFGAAPCIGCGGIVREVDGFTTFATTLDGEYFLELDNSTSPPSAHSSDGRMPHTVGDLYQLGAAHPRCRRLVVMMIRSRALRSNVDMPKLSGLAPIDPATN